MTTRLATLTRPTPAVGATVAALAVYAGAILAANAAAVTLGLIPVAPGLAAPAAVAFVGVALVARDLVHDRLGLAGVLAAIAAGTALSALVAPGLALASAAAFLISEMLDLAVYAPMRARGGRWVTAALASSLVGAVVDSVVFLALAAPFGLNLLPGQVVGKAEAVAVTVALVVAGRAALRRVR